MKKRVYHKACGNSYFKEKGSCRSAVGYILDKDADDNTISVFVPVKNDVISFQRPIYDDKRGDYGFIQTGRDGYRLTGIEPICIWLNESASSLWLLYHKIGVKVDNEDIVPSYTL